MTYSLWVEFFAAEMVELAKGMPAAQRRKFRTHARDVRVCAYQTIKQARREHRAGKTQSRGKKRKVMRRKHGGGRFLCNAPGCLYRVRVRAWKFSKRLQDRLQAVLSRSCEVALNKLPAGCAGVRDAKVRYARSRGTPIERRQRQHLTHVRTVREELRGASDWRVHHVTLNLRFDSHDPADLTVASLRRRLGVLKQVVPQLWKGLFDPAVRACMAAAWRIEVGHHGLVHLHLWYLGPARPTEDFITAAEAHANDAFSAKVKRVKRGEETRTLAYIAKPDGVCAEDWKRFKRGRSRCVPDPRLYARWAVATWKQDTVGTLGLFRRAR